MISRPLRNKALTLIELLLVVAIITILASLAAVNYLDAQIRAKVAAAEQGMRVLAVALEAYAADENKYPPAGGVGFYETEPFTNPVSTRLIPLTTPVSYLSSIPKDPFLATAAWGGDFNPHVYDTFDYIDADALPYRGSGITSGGAWRTNSAGPDLYQAYGGRPVSDIEANRRGVDYDPTNGTRSTGDIVRVGPLHERYGNPLDPQNINRPGIVRVPSYIEQWDQP